MDGRVSEPRCQLFLLVQIDPTTNFHACCRAFGQPELATGDLFATNAARAENAATLYAILQSQFETRDLAEWRLIFKANDIKWAPLPKLDDVVKDPQMRPRKPSSIWNIRGRVLETVNSPVFVSGVEKRQPTAAPSIGQHTREILRELGYGADAIEALVRSFGLALSPIFDLLTNGTGGRH